MTAEIPRWNSTCSSEHPSGARSPHEYMNGVYVSTRKSASPGDSRPSTSNIGKSADTRVTDTADLDSRRTLWSLAASRAASKGWFTASSAWTHGERRTTAKTARSATTKAVRQEQTIGGGPRGARVPSIECCATELDLKMATT